MTKPEPATDVETTVDARGATCPGPLMDLISAIRRVDDRAVVELLADTENTPTEVSEWAEESGNEVVDIVDTDDHYRIQVRKV